MPEISKITLPSGTSYDIKDATARSAIAKIHTFDYIVCTQASDTPYGVTWDSGETTITGTLAAASTTMYKIYLVPQDNATGDYFDEYITVNPSGTTYQWEKFGSTQIDIDNLGNLAYKDTASASYTPVGTVSQPTFSGSSTTSTGTFTPTGSVTVTPSTTSKYVASSATGGGSVTAGTACTMPTYTVSSEILTITGGSANTPTAVTLPSFAQQTIATGITSASFSGTEGSVSVSGTPSGTVTQPTFTGTASTIEVS